MAPSSPRTSPAPRTAARHGHGPSRAPLLALTAVTGILLAACPLRGTDTPDPEGEVAAEMVRSDVGTPAAGEGSGGLQGTEEPSPAEDQPEAAAEGRDTDAAEQPDDGAPDDGSPDDSPDDASLPDHWEGIRLGAQLPAATRARLDADPHRALSGMLAGIEVRARIATLPTGEVTHVAFTAPALDDAIDEDGLEQARRLLTEAFGTPSPLGDLSDRSLRLDDPEPPVAWLGDGHRWLVFRQDLCCGDATVVIRLQTDDPQRTCGPEDGFAAFETELREAIEARDRDRIAALLSFPFFDAHSEVYREEEDPFRLEDRAAFERHFDALLNAGALTWTADDATRASCDPRAGVQIYTELTAPLALVRTSDGWRAAGLDYAP